MNRFIPSWRTLVRHGWIIAATLLSGLEVALPIVGDKLPFDPITRAIGYGVIVAAALLARVVVARRYGSGP